MQWKRLLLISRSFYEYDRFYSQNRSHGDTEDIQKLRDDLATLSASFATMMEQKSKMEASYQADKKKMMVRCW